MCCVQASTGRQTQYLEALWFIRRRSPPLPIIQCPRILEHAKLLADRIEPRPRHLLVKSTMVDKHMTPQHADAPSITPTGDLDTDGRAPTQSLQGHIPMHVCRATGCIMH